MCFSFFQGKGYSGEFTENMQKMRENLAQNPTVILQDETDDVCARCPHNRKGGCISQDKVAEYDRQVLVRCGLTAGVSIQWLDFERLVREKILIPGRREEICGDCEWSDLC